MALHNAIANSGRTLSRIIIGIGCGIFLSGRCCHVEGSVAKIGWGRKKHGPGFSLGSNLEEALHESHLSANVAFPDPFNLPFSHHMHRFITSDYSTCRLETEETESGIDAPFDDPAQRGC